MKELRTAADARGRSAALLAVLAVGERPRSAATERCSASMGEDRRIPARADPKAPAGSPSPPATIYVSDYYHHAIDVFDRGSCPSGTSPPAAARGLGGPCQLAAVRRQPLRQHWHQGVVRLLPVAKRSTRAESTGVAVDPASDNVYVNDRTMWPSTNPPGPAPARPNRSDRRRQPRRRLRARRLRPARLYVARRRRRHGQGLRTRGRPGRARRVIDGRGDAPGRLQLAGRRGRRDRPPQRPSARRSTTSSPASNTPKRRSTSSTPRATSSASCPASRDRRRTVRGRGRGLDRQALRDQRQQRRIRRRRLRPLRGPVVGGARAFGPPAPVSTAASPAGARLPTGPGRGSKGPLASASEVVQRGRVRVSFDGSIAPRSLPRHGSAPVRVAVAAKIAVYRRRPAAAAAPDRDRDQPQRALRRPRACRSAACATSSPPPPPTP